MVVARERNYHHLSWTSQVNGFGSMPNPELSHRVDQILGAGHWL